MDSINIPLIFCAVVAVLGTVACIGGFKEVKEVKSIVGSVMLILAIIVTAGAYGLSGLQLGLFGKQETASTPDITDSNVRVISEERSKRRDDAETEDQ